MYAEIEKMIELEFEENKGLGMITLRSEDASGSEKDHRIAKHY